MTSSWKVHVQKITIYAHRSSILLSEIMSIFLEDKLTSIPILIPLPTSVYSLFIAETKPPFATLIIGCYSSE